MSRSAPFDHVNILNKIHFFYNLRMSNNNVLLFNFNYKGKNYFSTEKFGSN